SGRISYGRSPTSVLWLIWPLGYSTTTVPRVVCCLCQLGDIRKKRGRLANKKPHVRQKRESTHGNALGLGWANDRNNGKTSIEERARLGHDQGLVEELVLHLQIRKSHRNTGYRIDRSQGRRIARHIRPGLKMHCFRRANADQDSQHLSTRGSLCPPRVEAGATLFNGRKVESGSIGDRLQVIRLTCIRMGPGNFR